MIYVYPAEINKQIRTIFIDSEEERVYKWIDNGNKIPEENELIPDDREYYFGLEPPLEYLPKISEENCA